MQNSIWKLTALAGLVGIGFLVVLQAQRGLPDPADNAGRVTSSDADERRDHSHDHAKPGSDSDAEQALLFSDRESATPRAHEFPADASESLFGNTEPDGHSHESQTHSGHGAGPRDDGPFGPADAAHPAGEHPAGEPERLEIGDARLMDDGEHDPARPFAAGASDSPFAGDSDSVEVTIPPRRSEATDSTPTHAVQTAASQTQSAGPQLLAGPFAQDSTAGESELTARTAPGARIQPIPESENPFAVESPFEADPAPGSADTAIVGADDAAPHPSGFEELPASDAETPSALRLEPGEEVRLAADDEPAGAPSFGALPTVATDPFPIGDDEAPGTVRLGAPPTVAAQPPVAVEAATTADAEPADSDEPDHGGAPLLLAPGTAESTASTGEAGTSEPARLPDSAPRQEARPLQAAPAGARVVPLASDELKGDAIVGADAPKGAQQPQLTIEKKAPSLAVLGKPLVYSILVRNVGASPAHQVVVEDRIPKGSRLTGTIPRAELVDKKLIWKLGVLEPGEEHKIAVRVVPVEEGQIGSIATVNFVAEVASRTTITAPKLELKLVGPEEARLGQQLTFRFELANKGDGVASGVYLRNVIPEQLAHAAGSDLEYKVGDLAPGQSREINLSVTAARPGEAVNRAIVTADGGISIESTAELRISGNRLRLERSGPKRRFVGRDGEFTNTIVNDSDAAVSGVQVVETVPDGMSFLEASHGGRWDSTARTITWTIARIAPRERQTLTVKLAGRALGRQSSHASVRSAEGDTAAVTSETEIEGFTALDLSVADNKSPIDVGDTITLRVIAKNRGTEAASNVRISVSVPAEMEFVSAQGPVRHTPAAAGVEFAAIPQIAGRGQEEVLVVLKAVQAGSGDARVQITIDADQMGKPLKREEVVYILPETP